MNTNGNGHGKVLWWLVGMLATLVTSSGGAWLSSVHVLTRIHGEKIAVLESQMADQRQQLDRINQKLDRLLERPTGTRQLEQD